MTELEKSAIAFAEKFKTNQTDFQSAAKAMSRASLGIRGIDFLKAVNEYHEASRRIQAFSRLKTKKMTIKEVKKELGIKNADIARMFGYKNELSFNTSARRLQIEAGIIEVYKLTQKGKKVSR